MLWAWNVVFVCNTESIFFLRLDLRGWAPPLLHITTLTTGSGTSFLRSTTSVDRSCNSQLKSGTFLLGFTTLHSAQLIFEYFSLCMMFCKKRCSSSRSFVICICPCLVWIDAVSVKHYLNAIKAKQSALSARKPLVGGRELHLCSRPFGLELRPFRPRAYMDSPPLVE